MRRSGWAIYMALALAVLNNSALLQRALQLPEVST